VRRLLLPGPTICTTLDLYFGPGDVAKARITLCYVRLSLTYVPAPRSIASNTTLNPHPNTVQGSLSLSLSLPHDDATRLGAGAGAGAISGASGEHFLI
jgi:hypothetical protein